MIAVLFTLALGLMGVLSLRVVRPTQAAVVERMGRFHRLLGPGLQVLIPGVDRLCPLLPWARWGVIECRETTVPFTLWTPQQSRVSGHFWLCLDDVAAAVYAPQPLVDHLTYVAQGELMMILNSLPANELITLQWLHQWQTRLDPIWARWGVRLVRITIEAYGHEQRWPN
jgi:hypothetical protein